MKTVTAILFLCALTGLAAEAKAGQAEVRDVAMANNCTPKKIEVYKNSLGSDGSTIYRVTCNLPKTVGEDKPKDAKDSGPKPADALLISCQFNLCDLLRPVSTEKK